MSIRNSLLRTYFARRMKAIDRFRRHPDQVQAEMFRQLIARGADTEFGRRHGVAKHLTPEAFAARVGVQDYESFKPYIERMLAGEKNVAAPGRVTLFARSSGTTSDRSKFIPVTRESVWWNHTLGMRDVAAVYASAKPQTKIFDGKTLTLGGSYVRENGALIGDLSAVLISQTPFWSGWFRAPKMETALIPDFDRKIEGICRECTREKITAKLIPSEGMTYLETYNASEGFFSLADDLTRDDMLLMLDYGTYYEFRSGEQIVPLEGVRVGEVYAMIVTSINGLWRYEIGDTVEFTSTNPYRIRFSGRTRQFINAFGEELIVDNAERALAAACEQTGFMGLNTRGAHEWVLEFSERPDTPEHFAEVLDRELRSVNSDYDAKRQTALDPPRIHAVPPGTTLRWLQKTGKNKLPRMRNDRTVVEQLLKIEQ